MLPVEVGRRENHMCSFQISKPGAKLYRSQTKTDLVYEEIYLYFVVTRMDGAK